MKLDGDATQLLRTYSSRGHGVSALVRLALRPKAGHLWLLSSRFEFMGSVEKPSHARRYVYDDLVLVERSFGRARALNLLAQLSAQREVQVPGVGKVAGPQLHANIYRYQSGIDSGYVTCEWPTVYVEWSGTQSQEEQQFLQSSTRLVGRDVPLYPNPRTAILSFVHGHHALADISASVPGIIAFGFDHRARIMSLQLRGTILTVASECDPRMCCHLKLFGSSIPVTRQEIGVPIEGGNVSIDLGRVPNYLLIGLVSEEGELLDEREINFRWGGGQRDLVIVPETQEMVVRQWIEGGESDHMEFKQDINPKEDRSKTDLLESVVAFANCRGGTVILGIDDHGRVQGYRRVGFSDALEDMLRARCDPVPYHQVEEVLVNDVPTTLVHVGKSERPCCLDRVKFFIRAGATDRLARREELEQLFGRSPGR